MDGDNYFDLNVPLQELAFSWLRVHPTIASSYQAWERGDYPAETQFYVVDDDVEKIVGINECEYSQMPQNCIKSVALRKQNNRKWNKEKSM